MKKLLLLFACLFLAACGTGDPTCTGPPPLCSAGSPLVSMTLSSPATSIAVGATMQFSATGHYKNGSTVNITDLVQWGPDAPLIEEIDATGLMVGEFPGSADITAAAGSVTAFETVAVTP